MVDISFHSAIFNNSIFRNNRGSVIRVGRHLISVKLATVAVSFKVIGSKLSFYGNISFIHNNAEGIDGGAIYMLTFSQMILNAGAHLKFINNTGGYVTLYTISCMYS